MVRSSSSHQGSNRGGAAARAELSCRTETTVLSGEAEPDAHSQLLGQWDVCVHTGARACARSCAGLAEEGVKRDE